MEGAARVVAVQSGFRVDESFLATTLLLTVKTLLVEFGLLIEPLYTALDGGAPYMDCIAFPLFLLVSRIVEKKILIPSLPQIPVLFVLGFFGAYGNQLLYILGLYRTEPTVASIFANTVSVWTLLLGILCKLEPFDRNSWFSWIKLASIFFAAAGAVEVSLTGKSPDGEHRSDAAGEASATQNISDAESYSVFVIGCFMLQCSAIFMAIHLYTQKVMIKDSTSRLMDNWKRYPLNVMSWSYGFGCICYIVHSLSFVVGGKTEVFYLPFQAFYSVIYTVCITSVTCYLCLSWANYHSSPTLVTAFWPLQVVVAMIGAYFVTGDSLQFAQYIGVALILGGLFGVVFATHREKQQIITEHAGKKEEFTS